MSTNLIRVDELFERLKDPHIRIVDASWYMPSDKLNCGEQYRVQHIPGAVFFDIDEISDQSSPLPHMLPSAAQFANAVGELGIGNDDQLIIYDSSGLFSAARVWWMFQVFGHSAVAILDGGLPAGYALQSGQASVEKKHFTATLDQTRVINKLQMLANSKTGERIVLDARSLARFDGAAPEPRPGLPSGHIPNSRSLPFNELVSQGRLRPVVELRAILESHGAGQDTSVITSCGSGVTAAIISLALHEAGYGLQGLYDGAWVEWASSQDTTIATRSV